MSEMREILTRKKEILMSMKKLENDPSVKKYLELRASSEGLLDYLTLELEFSKLSNREHELMFAEQEKEQKDCKHPVKIINKQMDKHFSCTCVECGKKLYPRSTTNPLKKGMLFAQDPENVDLDLLREALTQNPRLLNLQVRLSEGEFAKVAVSKR
jgi:hypothetical protein